MNATFYTFSKRENSTARPTGAGQNYEIVLKDSCSLIAPQINLNLGTLTNPCSYNYCFIPEFNRYYFVRDWSFDRGLWTAFLAVDVLATWKNDIGAAQEYVARSAADYNGDIVDNLYPMTGEIRTSKTALSTVWTAAGLNPMSDGFYVVGVIGNPSNNSGGLAASTSGVMYYAMTPTVMKEFFALLYSQTYADNVVATVTSSYQEILTAINPLSYIASIRWYPIALADSGIDTTFQVFKISVGWGFIELGLGSWAHPIYDPVSEVVKTETLPAHPQAAARGRYMNKGQFTSRSVFFPPFGLIQLDSDKIAYADSVKLVFRIDYRSGTCYLTVYAVSDGSEKSVLAYVTAQASSDCMRAGITSNEWSKYEELQKGLAMGAEAGHALASSINEMGSITSFTGAAAGTIDLAATAAGVASDAMQLQGERARAQFPVLSSHGTDGAVAAFEGSPFIASVFQMAVEDDNAQRGRPLCSKRQLSTLPGYIVVSDPDLSIAGTAEENRAVKSYMASGFFYE